MESVFYIIIITRVPIEITIKNMPTNLADILNIVLMISVAAVSGLVGSFALMKRMALASDAISHIALPGLGLAILLNINPLWGGLVALVLGAIIIWAIESQTKISTETVIGVVFSASLAIGSLITPSHELEEVLFGDIATPSVMEGLVGLIVTLVIGFTLLMIREKIVLSMVSQDLARTIGLKTSRINFIFLLLFSINVLLGLKFLGVLLMGALVIVPAAVAKNLATGLNADLWLSSFMAVLSVVVGFLVASATQLTLGPVIISVATIFFIISILIKLVLRR
ncbi:MAG: metal ABC transporter permease [bacterium]|nr:metal ABC transporter permease [bacterium]